MGSSFSVCAKLTYWHVPVVDFSLGFMPWCGNRIGQIGRTVFCSLLLGWHGSLAAPNHRYLTKKATRSPSRIKAEGKQWARSGYVLQRGIKNWSHSRYFGRIAVGWP